MNENTDIPLPIDPLPAIKKKHGIAFRLGSIISSGAALSLLGFLFESEEGVLVGLSLILGIIVKVTDQLIDDPSVETKKWVIFPSAVSIPLIMGYLALEHDPVFGMVIGTGAGLLLAGKLDHAAYLISFFGFIMLIAVVIWIANLDIRQTSLYIIPIAGFGSFGDEFGHEKTSGKDVNNLIKLFFKHRFLLKAMAVLCVILDFADIIHLIAFLCFDIGYEAVAAAWKSWINDNKQFKELEMMKNNLEPKT